MSYLSKIKSFFLKPLAKNRVTEEKMYEEIAAEITRGEMRGGLWTKALSDAGFDEGKAKGLYIKYRLQSIKDEGNKYVAPIDTIGTLEAISNSSDKRQKAAPYQEQNTELLSVERESLEDNRLFLFATEEVNKGEPDAALWAKVIAQTKGNSEEAKYAYINARAKELSKTRLPDEVREWLERYEMDDFERLYYDVLPQLIAELQALGYKIIEGSSKPFYKGRWKIIEPNGVEIVRTNPSEFRKYLITMLKQAKTKGRVTSFARPIEKFLDENS